MPNPEVILKLITLSEAKDSSLIENIVTTIDSLYLDTIPGALSSNQTNEVLNYKRAIDHGVKLIKNGHEINTRFIVEIQNIIEPSKKGIRDLPGTKIMNSNTNEIIYTPPQDFNTIISMLKNLEQYIKNSEELDPIIYLAIIHYQLEAIHPFLDGNGKTGRILNILYLISKKKITSPILYLSKYINDNKKDYYRLLKSTNSDIKNIDKLVLFMIKGVKESSIFSINYINEVNINILLVKNNILEKLPELKDVDSIVTHMFSYLYTSIKLYSEKLNLSRNTATKHLNLIFNEGFFEKEKIGYTTYYKNKQLLSIIDT